MIVIVKHNNIGERVAHDDNECCSLRIYTSKIHNSNISSLVPLYRVRLKLWSIVKRRYIEV